jgi:hypothetical protein
MEKFDSKYDARAVRPPSLTPKRALALLPQGMIPDAYGNYVDNFTSTPTLEEAQWLCRISGVFVGEDLPMELFGVQVPSSRVGSLLRRASDVVEGRIAPG